MQTAEIKHLAFCYFLGDVATYIVGIRTNREVVFELKNKRAQWVYVQTSLDNSSNYVVTEGLNAGCSVIYKGNINLANQTPVRVKN